MRREGWATAIAVVASAALAVLGNPAEGAWAWSAIMLAWGVGIATVLRTPFGPPGPAAWTAMVCAAIAVRFPLLWVPPGLSDDVYRYAWEGRVWLAGFSPFAFAPDDPTLAPLRDALWHRVNHREVSSIYPPAAHLMFVALAPGGVLAFRIFMAACDITTAIVLFRRSPQLGWTWALLPLCVVEGAVSGHLESAAMLCVAVSLTRTGPVSSAMAWLGAMIKLLPAVLLVRRSPRTWLLASVASAAAVTPLLGAELTRGFETYRGHWSYNGSIFPALVAIGGDDAVVRLVLQALGVLIVVCAVLRIRDPARIALWAFGTFVVLSPTVHPWYGLWPLLAGLLTGVRAWTVLAVLLPAAYVVLATYDPTTSTWTEPWWVGPVIYLPFYATLLYDGWQRWRYASGASL